MCIHIFSLDVKLAKTNSSFDNNIVIWPNTGQTIQPIISRPKSVISLIGYTLEPSNMNISESSWNNPYRLGRGEMLGFFVIAIVARAFSGGLGVIEQSPQLIPRGQKCGSNPLRKRHMVRKKMQPKNKTKFKPSNFDVRGGTQEKG